MLAYWVRVRKQHEAPQLCLASNCTAHGSSFLEHEPARQQTTAKFHLQRDERTKRDSSGFCTVKKYDGRKL